MAHVDDRDLRHRLAFGQVRHAVEGLAVALGDQVRRARALLLELRQPLADIAHALVELRLGDLTDLLALGDRRRVHIEPLLRLLDALHLLDGALDDLVLLALEDLHLVQDRLVLLVVGRGVQLGAELVHPVHRRALLDLERVHRRLQLPRLRLEVGLLLLEQRELPLLRCVVGLGSLHAGAEGADLAVDSVKCQEIVEERHKRGRW